jgi:hypothetical protein
MGLDSLSGDLPVRQLASPYSFLKQKRRAARKQPLRRNVAPDVSIVSNLSKQASRAHQPFG